MHSDRKIIIVLIVSHPRSLYILSPLVLIVAPVVSLVALYCNFSSVAICLIDSEGPRNNIVDMDNLRLTYFLILDKCVPQHRSGLRVSRVSKSHGLTVV